MICPNCNTMNPNSIKKCIKCGAILEKSSGSAAIKPAESSGGPMLKKKEKPEKAERISGPIDVEGNAKKKKTLLFLGFAGILIIVIYLIFTNIDKLSGLFSSGSAADSTLAVVDTIPKAIATIPDTLKKDSVILVYKGIKKTAQDTTLYKSLSDADKAQISKKKKTFNDKFYYAKDNKKMVLIPAHSFIMGNGKTSEPVSNVKGQPKQTKTVSSSLEKPAHSVKVKDFYLDETEVTNGQFKRFLDESKYKPKGSLSHFRDRNFNKDDMPVVDVDYDDAVAYAEWAGKRLPTEREWESAAKDSQNFEFPTGNDMTESDARFGLNISSGSPVSVKSYRPNKFGIYDLAGNASEWVHGVIYAYPGNKVDSRSYGKARVPRGGSWMSPKEDCKTYRRAILDISKAMGNIGFRCAISKDEVIEIINK